MNKLQQTDLQLDREDRSFRRLVITIMAILFTLLLFTILSSLVTSAFNRITLGLADLFLFVALVLAWRGILLPARFVTPFVLYLALLITIVFGKGNGIFDTAMIGLAGVVILAGLFLGRRGAVGFGILVGVTILLMGSLDTLGIYSPKRPASANSADVGVILVVSTANSSLIYLLIQRLTQIATKARQNEALQIEANRELKELQASLEERVQERTQQLARSTLELETIAQIAREITSVRNLDTLLNLAARLIQERFSYYHVGIFIVDERNEFAVLRAASSIAAKTMLERHHKLRVGEVGIVGYTASTGLPRIALDVGADAVHFKNPLLPETRSEIALPLRSRSLTIGVLNIHATEASAFDQRSLETLQLMADQLVSAIENAQLVDRSETTLKELNATYQSQTRRAWQKTLRERGSLALEFDGLQIKQVPHDLPASILQQLERGKPAVFQNNNSNNGLSDHSWNTLVVPLLVLNQLIGVIGLEQDDPDHVWTAEEIAIAEAAAGRAAVALENARLLQDAQARAAKEQTIGEISAKIGSLVDLDNILQVAVEELSRSMPDTEVAIQFNRQQKDISGRV